MTEIVQDDITLTLTAQKVVTHEKVRVNVQVVAQFDPTKSETEFRNEVHEALHKLIDDEWKIQSINRIKVTKYENVTVQATTRIPEHLTYKLRERAEELSRIGFELINPTVDYSFSFDEIQSIQQELRLTLMKQALNECTAINKMYNESGYGGTPITRNPYSNTSAAHWRISSTRFDTGSNQRHMPAQAYAMQNIAASVGAPMAPAGGGMVYESSADAIVDGDAEEPMVHQVAVSTRFAMTGVFVLRSVVNA